MKGDKNILVLGAGLVGSAIALDLAKKFQVILVDRDEEALKKLEGRDGIICVNDDLSDIESIKNGARQVDLVVGAMPGPLAYNVLEAVIGMRKNIVDISFFEEDPFGLNDLAKHHGVSVVVDMGVAPGMSNFILGHETANMKVSDFTCVVGGLPTERTLPSEYKTAWSPMGVIEEYTRPARLMINGKEAVMPVLSDPEFFDFSEIGTLEALNTDGLRTLLKTMDGRVKNMREKTLRYPGNHLKMIEILKGLGYFSEEPIVISGKKIIPLDVTKQILASAWKLREGENEFTVMRLIIEGGMHSGMKHGVESGRPNTVTYDLLDYRDKETGISSMARTTGYACTAVANLLLEGKIEWKGIIAPEIIGENLAHFDFVMKYMAERGITYRKSENLQTSWFEEKQQQ